jgi:DNA-binding transcriptional ArsR family regulator
MPEHPTLYHLIDLWILLTRSLHQAAEPRDQENFGAHAGDLLIRSAVYLGTIEGRPMTAAKLATYVGIPRPTVVRHLRALERRGLVVRRAQIWCTPERLIKQRCAQDFSAIMRMVRDVNEKLGQAEKPHRHYG